MKAVDCIISWAISVVIGSMICGLFMGKDPTIILIFLVLSGLVSIPYLVIFTLIVKKVKKYIYIQLVHFTLAILTGIVFILFIPEAIRMSFVLLIYFVIGVIVQSILYYRRINYQRSSQNLDLLDEE